MNLIKRISLFLITNILILATISVVTNLLGLHGYLTEYGIDYQALAVIALVWGMTGSLISLFMSRWMAKAWMNIHLIDSNSRHPMERQLIQKVYHLARRVELNTMPEVGIYEANEVNAFATGPTRNRSLVAVSSGLLTKMNSDEIEGVLAHEISHIANGDMVTMTLLQGMINAFSMFLSRIIAYTLSEALSRRSDKNHRHQSVWLYTVLAIVFDILFTFLGSLVVAAFSRYREYRADQGGARLVGRQKMIAGLERLKVVVMPNVEETDVAAPLKINRKRGGFLSLLATHPDIDLRIAALRV